MKSTLIAFLLLVSQLTIAQIPQPGKNTYVNDFAGVLTPAQIVNLNQNIADLEKLHKVQLAVVLTDKIPTGYTIKQFAVQIGQQWHIGNDQRGIVYVAAIGQRKQSIQVGKGLNKIFTADQSQEMLKALKSSFRKKDYKGGLDILIDDINNAVPVAEGAKQAQAGQTQPVAADVSAESDSDFPFNIIVFVVLAVIIIIVVMFIRSRNRVANLTAQRNRGQSYGYYDVPPVNNPYGDPGSYQQTDHTVRNIATGIAAGAAAAYLADELMNNDNNDDYLQRFNDNGGDGFDDSASNNSFNNDSSFDDSSSSQRNDAGSWGDWGGSSDSSGDSGFSDSSDSGGSSDW